MSTDIVPAARRKQFQEIEAYAQKVGLATTEGESHMLQNAALAEGLVRLRAMVTDDVLEPVKALAGSSIGFKTDKSYPDNVIRDVFIRAALMGLPIAGNEFNIIGGELYVTAPGLERLLMERCGVRNIRVTNEIPEMRNGGAVATMHVEYLPPDSDEPITFTQTFAIRVNNGQGVDAIVGKGRRKVLKALYDTFRTNDAIGVVDGEVEPTERRRVSNTAQTVEGTAAAATLSGRDDDDIIDVEPDPAPVESPEGFDEPVKITKAKAEGYAIDAWIACRERGKSGVKLSRIQAKQAIDNWAQAQAGKRLADLTANALMSLADRLEDEKPDVSKYDPDFGGGE